MRFSRYMVGNFIKHFILVLGGSVLIFLVIDFVSNIRVWLNKGMAETSEYYLNYLPHIIYLILPIAILISVIGSLGTMARHLELTSYQGAGVGAMRMLSPLLLIGVLLSGGMFWAGENILPDANHRRLEMLQNTSQRKSAQRIKEKSNFVYVNSNTQSWYFRFYSGVHRRAQRVILLLYDAQGHLKERYDARIMTWNEFDEYWTLQDGFRRVFHRDGVVENISFNHKSLQGVVETRPEDIINERQTGDEMSSTMIRQRIEVLRRSGEETSIMETQLRFKYSGPWVAIITLLIGASLAHRYSRSSGISQKFGIGLFVAFSYYISIKVGLQLGEAGVLNPWFGAWVGNIVFGLFALVLLFRSFRL